LQRYVAFVDREKVGYDMLCFVNITLQLHQYDTVLKFRDWIEQMPEVLECFHVTGEYDYLLKVAIRNRKGLEAFIVHKLTPLPGIARIQTSLVLNEMKVKTAVPLDLPEREYRQEKVMFAHP
jgi:Lrp/AsnC family leucine-responsive transcriptional regulator